MSVRKYHYSLRNHSEERSSHLLCSESLKSQHFFRVKLRASLLTATGTKNSSAIRLVQEYKSQIRLKNRHHNDMHSFEKMSTPSIIVGRIMNQNLYGNHSTYAAENVCVRMRSDAINADLTVVLNQSAIPYLKDGENCGKSRQSQGHKPLNEIHQTSQLAFCVWAAPNAYRENECQHVFRSLIPLPAVKLRHAYSHLFPLTH